MNEELYGGDIDSEVIWVKTLSPPPKMMTLTIQSGTVKALLMKLTFTNLRWNKMTLYKTTVNT
jgi:hypothetical protein